MDTTSFSTHTGPTTQPRTGLALAGLILGILAVLSSLLVVGGLLGVLACLLGVFHIVTRRGPNGMAWGAIALGLLSIALSAGLAMLYVKGYEKIRAGLESWGSTETAEETALEDWIGVEAPELALTTLEGQTLRLSELRGRRVVLDFWATWCPPCRQEIPHFIQLARENTPDDLMIIGISSEDAETLAAFVAKQKVNYPIVSADDLPAPFDRIEAIPTTFFLDRRGIIQDVVVGYHDYESLKQRALAADTEAEPKAAPSPEPEPKATDVTE